MLDLRALTERFPGDGVVEAIWLRAQRDVPAIRADVAEAVQDRGLIGDRSAARPSAVEGGGKRQVTLLQAEHVPLIAAWAGFDRLDAGVLRRDLVVSGINLLAARSPSADRVLHVLIGDAVALAVTGDCAPCSKMEMALGVGGYNALRGHGGVTARVLRSGIARVANSPDRPRSSGGWRRHPRAPALPSQCTQGYDANSEYPDHRGFRHCV